MNVIAEVCLGSFFKKGFRKAGFIEELLPQFVGYFHEQGLEARGG